MAISPAQIRLMDAFVNDAKVQAIRDDPRKCRLAWAAVCAQTNTPASDYAETLQAWHKAQRAPRGSLRVSTPDAEGMITVSIPAPDGGTLGYTLQARTLLLHALSAYAGQYSDPVRFLQDAEGLARSAASRLFSPPEPR